MKSCAAGRPTANASLKAGPDRRTEPVEPRRRTGGVGVGPGHHLPRQRTGDVLGMRLDPDLLRADPLDPGARVPLPLLGAQGRGEREVAAVAGGLPILHAVVAGVDPGQLALGRRVDQLAVRDLARVVAGQVVDVVGVGVRSTVRRRPSFASGDQPRARVAVHVATGIDDSPTYSMSPPTPSLTTISARAPASAAAVARCLRTDRVAPVDHDDLAAGVDARVVGRRAAARRTPWARCAATSLSALPGCTIVSNAHLAVGGREPEQRLALAPAGGQDERALRHRLGGRDVDVVGGRGDGIGAAHLHVEAVDELEVHLALPILGQLRRLGLQQPGVARVEHHLAVLVEDGLGVDQYGDAGPVGRLALARRGTSTRGRCPAPCAAWSRRRRTPTTARSRRPW